MGYLVETSAKGEAAGVFVFQERFRLSSKQWKYSIVCLKSNLKELPEKCLLFVSFFRFVFFDRVPGWLCFLWVVFCFRFSSTASGARIVAHKRFEMGCALLVILCALCIGHLEERVKRGLFVNGWSLPLFLFAFCLPFCLSGWLWGWLRSKGPRTKIHLAYSSRGKLRTQRPHLEVFLVLRDALMPSLRFCSWLAALKV